MYTYPGEVKLLDSVQTKKQIGFFFPIIHLTNPSHHFMMLQAHVLSVTAGLLKKYIN